MTTHLDTPTASAAPAVAVDAAATWLLIGGWPDAAHLPPRPPNAFLHTVLVLDAASLPSAVPDGLPSWPMEWWHGLCADATAHGFAQDVWQGHSVTVVLASPPAQCGAVWRELHCQADAVWIAPQWLTAATAAATSVARLCRREAQLCLTRPKEAHDVSTMSQWPETMQSAWQQAGFVWLQTPSKEAKEATCIVARYRPRWPVPARLPVQRCAIVIGAGLAGAAVCHRLTQRGWSVTLIDQGSGPAQGASALPVGMMSEHRTANDTPLSQLSRLGLAVHRRRLARDVPVGAGWQPTAVTNRRVSAPAHALGQEAPSPDTDTCAALVRPSALVAAWLKAAHATGRCTVVWNAPVERLTFSDADVETEATPRCWRVWGAGERLWASAPHVIVTAAFGSAALLSPHAQHVGEGQTLRPVKGQLSYGPLEGHPLAEHAQRDQGVFVPSYEDCQHSSGLTRLWAMGSTYERGQIDTWVTDAAHQRNAQSLHAMIPAAAARLQAQQARGVLQGWAGIRCASLDRMPLVGAVPHIGTLKPSMRLHDVPRVTGLWTICALGSRGLSVAELLAAHLVAQLEETPWPMPRSLGETLDPARFALKAARR